MVPGCIAAKPKVWPLAAPLAIASAVAPAQAAIRDRIVDMGLPFSVLLSAPLAWRLGGACSIHRLRRDIVHLEILHSARMVCDLILPVGERRRELAQHRLHRDKLGLVVDCRRNPSAPRYAACARLAALAPQLATPPRRRA